jgi:hypothetical protein
MHYKRRRFGCDRSLAALYLENQVPFQLYLGFHWRNFPHNSYFALPACATKHDILIAVGQYLRALYVESHEKIFVLISAPVRGISLKIHTSHSPRMRHKLCHFGCDPSLIKVTLLGELSTYSAPRLAMEGFFLKSISRNFRAYFRNEVRLVVFGHYLRGNLLGE